MARPTPRIKRDWLNRRVSIPRDAGSERLGIGDHVDLREVAVGAFVVTMAVLGSQVSPALFALSMDFIVVQAVFELPMALLAVCAGQALALSAVWKRAVMVGIGVTAVALAGSVTALQLDVPGAIVGGIFLIVARAARPPGTTWFSVEHCRAIELTAGTAWACLIGAFALLMLYSAIFLPPGASEAPGLVYAFVWGSYYLALALVLPRVRRYFGGTTKDRR
jgi:hypothetical protein